MFPSAGEKVPLSPSLVEKKQLGPSCIVVRYLPCKKRQLGPSCNVERWDSSAKMHDDGLETVHDHSFPCTGGSPRIIIKKVEASHKWKVRSKGTVQCRSCHFGFYIPPYMPLDHAKKNF